MRYRRMRHRRIPDFARATGMFTFDGDKLPEAGPLAAGQKLTFKITAKIARYYPERRGADPDDCYPEEGGEAYDIEAELVHSELPRDQWKGIAIAFMDLVDRDDGLTDEITDGLEGEHDIDEPEEED
jgi:hypothetical protein